MFNNRLIPNNALSKNAILSFQTYHSIKMCSNNLNNINLISSSISTSSFNKVSFYNASFFSTKFSEVIFEGCILTSTDICSVWINKCEFNNADFSDATISDSTFINCSFVNSIFYSTAVTRCQFINCTFDTFPIDDSTFSLNSFNNCYICKTYFTESFYYQMFYNCTFQKVKMSPELLGYNFGFSLKNFSQLTEGINLSKLYKRFLSKGLFINAAILRINQAQNFYDEAMVACIAALGKMLDQNVLIKSEELEFLKNLTAYFQENKLIAPITTIKIWEILNNYISNELANTAVKKAMPYIREYVNMLYFDFGNFQNNIQKNLMQIPQNTDILTIAELEIVYHTQPTEPLLDYLLEFSKMANPNCPIPRLIRTEQGSFHEFHEIAVIIIPYLQTLFSFLSVIVPIVIYEKQKTDKDNNKQQTEAVVSDKENKSIEIVLKTNITPQSPILLPDTAAFNSNSNMIISDVIRVLDKREITKNAGFNGYNAKNIQSITIRFQ